LHLKNLPEYPASFYTSEERAAENWSDKRLREMPPLALACVATLPLNEICVEGAYNTFVSAF
jgi:hypothetical protein